jgi:hypothetical protein
VGAAALLALDEAATRSRSGEVRLINFGPVDPDTVRSYSEQDVYWAIVEHVEDKRLQFFLIDDKGAATFVGAVPRPPDPTRRVR